MEILINTVPYVTFFSISTFFCYLSQVRKFDKTLRFVLLLVAMMVPSIVAAIRYDVGTDYYNHLGWYSEISSGINYSRDILDIGFVYVARFFSFVNIGFPGVLFTLSFITTFCVLKVLLMYKDIVSVTFGYFVYLFVYYQLSLNLMRQVTAGALFILSLAYIIDNKKILAYTIFFLAFSFHSSVIIGLPMLLWKNIFVEEKYTHIKKAVYIILMLIIFSLPILAPYIVSIMLAIGRYVYYFAVGMGYQPIGIGFFRYLLLLLLPGFMFRKNLKNYKSILLFYSTSIVGYILWLSSYVSTNVIYRVAYNNLIALIICSAFFYKQASYKKLDKQLLIKVFLVLPILIFWIYDYFYLGAGETVPYITIFSN